MKCDKLKEYKAYEYGTSYVYDIGEVNEAIAELKAENYRMKCELDLWRDGNIIREETLNEIESLKASNYAEMVDAGMENRRLKRALWLLRAYSAYMNKLYINADWYIGFEKDLDFWTNTEKYCLAKAKEYK